MQSKRFVANISTYSNTVPRTWFRASISPPREDNRMHRFSQAIFYSCIRCTVQVGMLKWEEIIKPLFPLLSVYLIFIRALTNWTFSQQVPQMSWKFINWGATLRFAHVSESGIFLSWGAEPFHSYLKKSSKDHEQTHRTLVIFNLSNVFQRTPTHRPSYSLTEAIHKALALNNSCLCIVRKQHAKDRNIPVPKCFQ